MEIFETYVDQKFVELSTIIVSQADLVYGRENFLLKTFKLN